MVPIHVKYKTLLAFYLVRFACQTISNSLKLAKIYLAASTTSTASERLFSDAGNLISVKRTHIAPELLKSIMFLKGI
ncbi:3078_t:CDS:2 [Rhizophagus irregularis]|nr:3078_t:CDS:2 [Rhizophagus irregularis]